MQDATTMSRNETAKQKIEAAIRAIDCALTERPQAIVEITSAAQDTWSTSEPFQTLGGARQITTGQNGLFKLISFGD